MNYIFFAIIATIFAYLSLHVVPVLIRKQVSLEPGLNKQRRINLAFWVLSFLTYFIPAAIRYGIGQDYFFTYAPTFEWIRNGSISIITNNSIEYNELGFTTLNKLIAYFTADYQWLFVITSLICLLLAYKCIRDYSSNIPMSVFMLVLGSYYLATYNFVRQTIAIALFTYSLRYIEQKRPIKYYSCILLAISMHTISIVYIPFYFLANMKMSKKQYVIIPIVAIMGLKIAEPIVVKIISLTRFVTNISYGNNYHVILSLTILIVYYFALLGFANKEDDKYRMYLNILLIAGCFIGLSTYTGATDRLIYAYYYTNFITIPYIFNNARWRQNRNLISVSLILLLSVLWGFEHLYYDQFGILPYVSIFAK